jgi:hypothetical protein
MVILPSSDRSGTIAQLVYTSTPIHHPDASGDGDILSVARRKNAEHGISGFLLRSDTLFLQYIEGPDRDLMQLMDNIRHDPRHSDIVAYPVEHAQGRRFPRWSMGYSFTVGEEQFAQTVRHLGARIPMDRVAARLVAIAARGV